MITKIVKRIDPALVIIVLSLALTIGSVLCAWDVYTDHVGSEYSNDSAQWAALGGYLAGIGSVLGPILSAASILFVWWQSKEATANQQAQLGKLNEQLGLEKQNIFRDEFIRLQARVLEHGSKEIKAGHDGVFKERLGFVLCSQKKLAESVKANWFHYDQKISDEHLEIVWRVLNAYLAYLFELADLLCNRGKEFGLSDEFMESYIRQFQVDFVPTSGQERLLYDELLKSSGIHNYSNIDKAFKRESK